MNPPAEPGRKAPLVRCSISVYFGPGQSNTDDQASVVIRFLSVTESNRVHQQLRPRTVDARVPAPAMGARTPTRAVGCGRRGVPGRVHGAAGRQHRDADLPAAAGRVQHRAGQRAVGIAFVSGGSGGAVGSGGSVGGLARTQTVVPIWVRPVLTCFRCVCPCTEPGLARGRARVPGSRDLNPGRCRDVAGFGLLAGVIVSTLLVLSGLSGMPLPSAVVVGLCVVAVLTVVLFWRTEARAVAPLVDTSLLRRGGLGASLAGALLAYLLLFAPLVLYPSLFATWGLNTAAGGICLL